MHGSQHVELQWVLTSGRSQPTSHPASICRQIILAKLTQVGTLRSPDFAAISNDTEAAVNSAAAGVEAQISHKIETTERWAQMTLIISLKHATYLDGVALQETLPSMAAATKAQGVDLSSKLLLI